MLLVATCVVAEVATRKTFRRHRTAWASLGTDTRHEHPLTSININLVGGLEHDFYDFPYIGNNHPNWFSYFSEGLKPPTSNYIRLYQWVYQTVSKYIRLYQTISVSISDCIKVYQTISPPAESCFQNKLAHLIYSMTFYDIPSFVIRLRQSTISP